MKDQSVEKTLQKFSGIFNAIIVIIFFVIIGYIGYKVYLLMKYQPKITKQEVQLKKTEEVNKIDSTIEFAKPTSTDQQTGRSDPMAPF